jgi:hypothetical protein
MTERWKIFEALCEHPMGLAMPELVEVCYAGRPDGGPIAPESAIRNHIQRFNIEARTKRLGIRISSVCESGRRFRVWILREPKESSTESTNTNIPDHC